MNLDELIQLQVLKRKSEVGGGSGRSSIKERLLNGEEPHPQLRQMCAKVSIELHNDVENICTVLDLSKREFIEQAVIEAVRRAEEVIERSGGIEAMGFKPKEGT